MLKLRPGTTSLRWTIWRAHAFLQRVQVLDGEGAPRDLTGASARLLLTPLGAELATLEATMGGAGIAIVDAATGVLDIALSPTQTRALTAGDAALDLAVTAADGAKLLHLRARIPVRETQDARQGDAVVPETPDALGALVEDRPEITDAVSATERWLVTDPNRGPNRFAQRPARPILDAKADLASPAFSGAPTAPTPAASDNSTRIATTAMAQALVAALVNNAPATLATLQQLAAAISNSPTFGADVLLRLGTLESGQGATAIGYATKAAMDADLARGDGVLALVTNDSTAANNQMYRKSGASGSGSWIAAVDRISGLLPGFGLEVLAPETGYCAAWIDPVTSRSCLRLTLDGRLEIDSVTLPAASVDASNLSTELQTLVPTTLPIESGYVWALVDPVTSKAPLRMTVAGVLEIDSVALPASLALPAGVVTLASLAAETQQYLPQDLIPESGYVWGLVDPVTGRAPVRLSLAGALEVDSFIAGASTVGLAALTDDAKRQLAPNAYDVVQVRPDVWRGRRGETAALTEADGSLWSELGALRTRWLGGINSSGTAIELRRSAGLPVLGRKYGGSFDASVKPSIADKGVISSTTPGTPSGSFVTGDFYRYVNGNGDPGAYGGDTLNVGDLLVYNGSSWAVRVAPGSWGARVRGQWWDVSAAGWWDGVQYAVGDRIVYVGKQPGGGGNQYERWARMPAGDGRLYYRGEFAPGSGLPSTYLEGDLFQASAGGSAGGLTFAAGDYLVRDKAAWGLVANPAPQAVAAGAYVSLQCSGDASEWEVRRQDKSSTQVGVRLGAWAQSVMRRQRDDLALLSDSMFGVGSVGSAIITAAGRGGTVRSYGGGTSLNVLGMLEWAITQGDVYAGQTLLAWHGQNNQPFNEANAAQIRYVSLRMAELAGARDARMLFLSVLGQRNHSWSGTRIVVSQHEDQRAGTSYLNDLNLWYEATFPGRWISPWRVLLAAATDAPDPTFPGMTEKQVAATYGIAPWSCFGSPGGSWSAADLVYQGTWNTAGLPTGGSSLQYYLRIGGGTVGNLLVNESGTWVERAIDITHLSAAGAAALAAGGPGQSGIAASSGVAGFLKDRLL